MYTERAAECNPIFRSSLEESFKISATDYARALVKRNAILRVLEKFLDHADLLWPVMSAGTPPFDEFAPGGVISAERAEDLLRFTAPLSLTGQPALASAADSIGRDCRSNCNWSVVGARSALYCAQAMLTNKRQVGIEGIRLFEARLRHHRTKRK
jgi:hypothetical protein